MPKNGFRPDFKFFFTAFSKTMLLKRELLLTMFYTSTALHCILPSKFITIILSNYQQLAKKKKYMNKTFFSWLVLRLCSPGTKIYVHSINAVSHSVAEDSIFFLFNLRIKDITLLTIFPIFKTVFNCQIVTLRQQFSF